MGTTCGLAAVAALAILLPPGPRRAVAAAESNSGISPLPAAQAPAAPPRLQVKVDPRVELLSLIFRLAGNPEYNRARVDSYTDEVEAQFGKFRNHAVVELAQQLRHERGVSYDACMSLAVHLSDVKDLHLRIALAPWPESLDGRWTPESVTNFLVAARQFIKGGGFQQFLEKHRALYETTESRMKALMEKQGHLEWFDAYFGERARATFRVELGLLNGGNCYGPHFRDATGREELYCILGVWQTDAEGRPEFRESMLDTVVHEFCHSYANPLIDRHEAELHAAGEILFSRVAETMRSQAYGNATTMLRESLVRACVIRYVSHYQGSAAARGAIREEEKRGFLWMRELSALLGEYEEHRTQYATLDSFAPRLGPFFSNYAADFTTRQAALNTKRPKVSSMIPANGAKDVDPGLTEISVTFDRPMKDRSWSMCGSGPNFPTGTDKPRYDAKRTTWIVPVKLKPDWDYEFSLNCMSYDSFRSEDNVPLEPVAVNFRTASEKATKKPDAKHH